MDWHTTHFYPVVLTPFVSVETEYSCTREKTSSARRTVLRIVGARTLTADFTLSLLTPHCSPVISADTLGPASHPTSSREKHLVRLLYLRQFDGRSMHIPQNVSTQALMGQWHFENATISGGSFLHVDENHHHCLAAGELRSRISTFQKLTLNSRHPSPEFLHFS